MVCPENILEPEARRSSLRARRWSFPAPLDDLPYKPPDDYELILNTISLYTLLAVEACAPCKTAQEFAAAARASPGTLRVGSPGEGTISHLTLERWSPAGNFKTTHVPASGRGREQSRPAWRCPPCT